MFKSVRVASVVATLVAVVLTLSQVVVFAVSSSQESAASSSDREKFKSNKSKKRKKKRTKNSTAPFLVTTPTTTQSPAKTTASATVTADLTSAGEAASAPVRQTTRGTSRAARIPGARISPIVTSGVPTPNVVFSNPGAIAINDNAPATPYPSNITVSGLTGSITSLTLTITGFTHVFPLDVEMLLVSPDGTAFQFWSDTGGSTLAANVNVAIDDAAVIPIPPNIPLVSGSYKPTATDDDGLIFPLPAPASYSSAAPTGTATLTSVFGGLTPAQANGTWSLYVFDDAAGDAGRIFFGWSLDITEAAAPPTAGQIIISEFRQRGIGAAFSDEFIELYNNSGADITVTALSGTGLGVAASDGITRCTVPNTTVIPAGGHYLCVNSVGYALGPYPAGNGTTATGDATYTTDIPVNAGIALFNNNTGGASYSLANRLDAVGSTDEANTLYKEGTGVPVGSYAWNYAFYRDTCGKGGSVTTMGACTISTPKDTDDNAADFLFVHTLGFDVGAGTRLGGPGPENLSSPIQRNAAIPATLLDPCVAGASAPNRVRDFTAVANGSQGTLDIRRTFTNNTGASITRLRYRIIDITTFEPPLGIADLRAITSTDVPVTVDRAPCGSVTSTVTVTGTTLEEPAPPPLHYWIGGGFNTSLSSGSVTLATPLANGASIDIRWVFGIMQTGLFKIYVNIEALP